MPPTARGALCELVSAWSARWHAVTEAAGLVEDPAERARLLAVAEGIEACDLDARRAVRELLTAGLR
jgi:hypothetical protein